MDDLVLVDGDLVIFLPAFGAAVVAPVPGALIGTGEATLQGKKLCVVGDEDAVSVPGCPYVTPQFVVPGAGTLKIGALAGDQQATKTKTGGKAVLLKGSQFTAKFEVQSPAQDPSSGAPVPDPTVQYSGQGMFVTTNLTFRGV